MILYAIMGGVVLAALGLFAFLFVLLKKEGVKPADPVVPVTDFSEFKKDVPTTPLVSDLPVMPTPSAEEEQYKKRAEELEEELHQISEKAVGQAQEALSMIEQLNKENEALKAEKEARIAEQESKINDASDHLTQLRQDNNTLQVQLDNSHEKLQSLENEVVAIKMQMGAEIANANQMIEQLRVEKEQREQAPPEDQQLQTLKEEMQTLLQANLDLQRTNQKLKELNDHSLQKAELLQYELTKVRAQASGFERICSNYKAQLEVLLSDAKSSARSNTNRLPANAQGQSS